MASTRNLNTYGNYNLEEEQFRKMRDYNTYIHSSCGPPHSIGIATGGSMPPSKMYRDSLSRNAIDIESRLFGIGSTNLVKPLAPVYPSLKPINDVTFFVRPKMILPAPLKIEGNQRFHPNINS
tara:strand:- start:211 stop:579 length:369 start_codon:yes stop_codon:yes gene_type:complete